MQIYACLHLLCVAGMGVTCVSLQYYRCKQNCPYFFSEPGLIREGAINYCSKTIILLVLPITGGHFNPNCKPTINSMYALSRVVVVMIFWSIFNLLYLCFMYMDIQLSAKFVLIASVSYSDVTVHEYQPLFF